MQEGHAPALSDRERQLLMLASQGLTDQAIANRLGISLATVGTYWGRIRIKLGPLNRTELVANYLRAQAGSVVERLRAENKELMAEVSKHVEAEKEMQSTVALMKELLFNAPDAIIVVDAAGAIRMSNKQASQVFGYSSAEFNKLHLADLVPASLRAVHLEHHRLYFDNPVRKTMGSHEGTMALHKDGREFPIAASLSGVNASQGHLAICVFRELETDSETPA